MENEIYDVAIVGYGPTGQALAIFLGQKGYRVAVFERWHEVYPLPRAIHYDHEIARVLQAAGVAEQVAPILSPLPNAFYEWRNADRELLLQLDWNGTGPSGWPVANIFSQPELEQVLDAKARSFSTVEVNRGWEAIAAVQHDDSVSLTVRKGESPKPGEWTPTDETRTIRARYLVGADGANSIVRQWMGVTTTDLGFKYDWFVVDVKPHQEREWVPNAWQWCNCAGPTSGKNRGGSILSTIFSQTISMSSRNCAWASLSPATQLSAKAKHTPAARRRAEARCFRKLAPRKGLTALV